MYRKGYASLMLEKNSMLPSKMCLRLNLEKPERHLSMPVLLQVLNSLVLLRWRSLSYRNQSIDLQSKAVDWFLYDTDFRHERVNSLLVFLFLEFQVLP